MLSRLFSPLPRLPLLTLMMLLLSLRQRFFLSLIFLMIFVPLLRLRRHFFAAALFTPAAILRHFLRYDILFRYVIIDVATMLMPLLIIFITEAADYYIIADADIAAIDGAYAYYALFSYFRRRCHLFLHDTTPYGVFRLPTLRLYADGG